MNQPGKIYALIPKIMAEVGHIGKDRNAGTGGGASYKFRGIDDVFNAFQPVLAKHGVFCAPMVIRSEREERQSSQGKALLYTFLHIQFRFYADDGSFVETVMVGEAMDSGDKSANKAMSAAMKYAFFQVFCVPTEDDNDTENHTHDVAPKVAPRAAVSPAKLSAVGCGAFCEACGTELILSKAGTGYYCPKFQDKSSGIDHSRFPIDQLEGVKNYQAQERMKGK